MQDVGDRLVNFMLEVGADNDPTPELYCKALALFDPKDHPEVTKLFMIWLWDSWCQAHFPKHKPSDAEIEEGVEKAIAFYQMHTSPTMRLH